MAHRREPGRALSKRPTYGPDDVDQYLVGRAVAHEDSAAFGELVRRHQSRVRLYLRRLCRDDALADDLAQDTFMHAWDRLPGFRGDGSFIGWLLRIAWTTFLQAKRRGDRYRDVLHAVSAEDDARRADAVVPELADLERLLAVLSEDERRVMILSYALGLSHQEISDATDMPVGTVKSVIHRGKLKVRDSFDIETHQYG